MNKPTGSRITLGIEKEMAADKLAHEVSLAVAHGVTLSLDLMRALDAFKTAQQALDSYDKAMDAYCGYEIRR